jgi:Na+-translocating ferredoxin:NAD+ oxidoreductase subunit B
MTVIIASALIMLVLAIVMAVVLGWAKQAFHVEIDPRVEQIDDALPAANCGACGYAGCMEYAEAVAAGDAPVTLCTVGGADVAEKVAAIMGVEAGEIVAARAVVKCGAKLSDRLQRNEYLGERTCSAATNVAGVQGCTYGCLGFGDCVAACDYDAIHIVDGLAVVDYEKCIGCAACVRACPRNIIEMVDFESDAVVKVACSSRDDGKTVKSVCQVGCIACKRCAKESDVFLVEDNLASVCYEKYDPAQLEDVQKAIESCPTNCIVMAGK